MDEREIDQRLSLIATQWTLLDRARGGAAGEAAVARRALVERYCGAVYRYLLGAARDPNVADDLTQEFALRFIQGRFDGAERGRGRFRSYVKTALFHLVADHHRRQGQNPRAVPLDDDHAAAPDEGAAADRLFRESWRQELLSRAWKSLERHQRDTGQPYFDLLRFRVDHPDTPSAGVAEQLGARMRKTLTAAGVRQALHRARERFADLLLDEVRASLPGGGDDALHDELAELNLLKYCQDALGRRAGS